LAAVCAAILPVAADAQEPAIDRIEVIERQIGGLQKELQQLKRELEEAKRAPVFTAASSGPVGVTSRCRASTIKSA
jgi:hypothetical protein